MQKIKIAKYHNIVILTGAGVSVASGLKPYRGVGSINDSAIAQKAHVDRLKDNPRSI